MKRLLSVIFWIIAATHLSGIAFSSEILTNLTKPLLVPTLALWFWLSTAQLSGKVKIWFLSGLLFSTAGDIFLMYRGSSFFLLGLSSFLVAHLFYIFAFYKFPNFKDGLAFRKSISILPVIIFLVIFLVIVFPKVPDQLGAPVLVYSLVIALMVISAINLLGRINQPAAITILTGAVLFLLSDSILACEKFNVVAGNYAMLLRLSVMATYLTGQYFLTVGVVKALKPNYSV